MITGYRPSPSVETISEGIMSNATDAATGWVVNGMGRHGHGGVLMGVESNGEVVKDRPCILPSFYCLLIR